MTIFTTTIRRILRNKVSLVFMLLVPGLMISFVYGFGSWGPTNLSLGIVDLDETQLTQMLSDSLSEKAQVYSIDEDSIRRELINGNVDYVLVLPSGFTSQIIAGSRPAITGYSIQGSDMAAPVRLNADSFVSAAASIAAAANGNADVFYQGMEHYLNGSFTLEALVHEDVRQGTDAALASMGLLAMTMMLLSSFGTLTLIQDRENRTFFRAMTTPLRLPSYMLQSILAFFLVLLGQVSVLFLLLRFGYGLSLGAHPFGLYGLMALFALLCVSMGMALASLARTTRQAGTIATLFITPMAMLGGLFWPRWLMPQFLQDIGQFLPTSWLMDAAENIVMGSPLADSLPGIAILAGFTLIFFLLGAWRRADIAR